MSSDLLVVVGVSNYARQLSLVISFRIYLNLSENASKVDTRNVSQLRRTKVFPFRLLCGQLLCFDSEKLKMSLPGQTWPENSH